jgi:crotonobetainyl-CoA:carnitine CoA-transferase CaiB-like acyl-CoA transferase
MSSGLWIAIAILTGLVGRGKTGKGCHIDLAMMDVQASLLALAAARLFALDEDTTRAGTEHPGRVPSAAFQCKDGSWLHISGSDQHWSSLCAVLDLGDLASDPTLATNRGRVTARDLVMAGMRTAIAAQDRAPLAERLRAAGIPAGEVNTVREILHDTHMIERQVVGNFDHPTVGRFSALRTPIRFDGFDDPAIGCPPQLGADTRSILSGELGLSREAIAKLETDGVI